MQKALAELENEKLIYTERTNGKYVTEDEALIEKVKKELAQEKVNHYLNSMKSIGISYQSAVFIHGVTQLVNVKYACLYAVF